MNELFAADPVICEDIRHLRTLLGCFGHYTGRYLAAYPSDWRARIEARFSNVGDIEQARLRTILRRAKENGGLAPRQNIPWSPSQSWIDNIATLKTQPSFPFNAVVLGERPVAAEKLGNCTVHLLGDFDLPPTADERIDCTVVEYCRVSQSILTSSTELAMVDPYLNPCKKQAAAVLTALLAIAANGTLKRLVVHARATEVLGASMSIVRLNDVKEELGRIAKRANLKPNGRIELMLWDDADCVDKMHARYLLSIKGGIRFDQGFQVLPIGRRMDVCPLGEAIHEEIAKLYLSCVNNMKLMHHVVVKS